MPFSARLLRHGAARAMRRISRIASSSSPRTRTRTRFLVSASNGGAGSQGESMASQLTEACVQERATELFPGGTGVPAVKPRQPPLVENPTSGFAKLVFTASKRVTLIRGVLARERPERRANQEQIASVRKRVATARSL